MANERYNVPRQPVSIYGSNTRQWATDSITIGTGAAHAAGDVVSTNAGAILEFETGLPSGSSGIILSSLATLNQSAVFASGAGYDLELFTISPTVQATNAVFNLDNLAGYIGSVAISTLVDKGANCAILDTGHNLDFTLEDNDTKLYGKLVAKGGETTITGAIITLNLGIAAL